MKRRRLLYLCAGLICVWVAVVFIRGKLSPQPITTVFPSAGKPNHQLNVQSVAFRSVTPQEAKDGYDIKVSITAMPHGIPPQLKGKKYVGGDITVITAELLSQTDSNTTPITKVKPHIQIVVSKPIVVSFLLKKHDLPKTKVILRTVLRYRYGYKIQDKTERHEFHNPVLTPVEVIIFDPNKK